MKEILKRISVSFCISSFAGLIVNLIIDALVNAAGNPGFISISPAFRDLFPTPVLAAYINILLYGVIGATFAGMTFIFDVRRLGYIIQWCIYFLITFALCIFITVFLWELHKVPQAMVCTLSGYAVTYIIIGVVEYRQLKTDISEINQSLSGV
ncbi:MAG: DUF3021 domain-containing protein [Lachnospiraceae bacterium]|nr:DUF3021 domain-containing protein [Lachnospiraceae bacterium]